MVDVGIIGGTGIGSRLASLGGKPFFVPTPAGMLRGRRFTYEGAKILLISRHSAGHKVPPHRVAYAPMALAMQQLGVKACLSSAAVGSLRPEWGAGTFVLCSDFLDLTFRNLTLFDRTVEHRDFCQPFANSCRDALLQAARERGFHAEPNGVYVCGNGPRYETPHEIKTYRELGGDVVGMTATSEAILMREAGVPYGCLAIVTNLAAGISPVELSHEEVVEEMERSGEKAVELLLHAAVTLSEAS